MPTKYEHVPVRFGDRTYLSPSRCNLRIKTPGWEGTVTVEVVDGRALYREVRLVCTDPLEPVDVQRLPWGRIAEMAISENTLVQQSPGVFALGDGQELIDERKKSRRAKARRDASPSRAKRRRKVDESVLRRVM